MNETTQMIEYLKTIISELLAHTVRIKNNYNQQIEQHTLIALYELLENHSNNPLKHTQTLTDTDIENIQQIILTQYKHVSERIIEITGFPLCQYF